MRDETIIDVYTSGVTGAEYDAGMKQLMSNKEIIIPILQMTVPEFKMCSQEEILQCLDISSITKDDFVSDIPNIERDLRLTKEDEQLKLLATDGMLVKRPLVIGDDFVLTGFREKEWIEAIHV